MARRGPPGGRPRVTPGGGGGVGGGGAAPSAPEPVAHADADDPRVEVGRRVDPPERRVDRDVGAQEQLLHVDVHQPVRRELDVEADIERDAEGVAHVDVENAGGARAALAVEHRPVHAGADVGAEALGRQRVVLEGERRRQGPDPAEVDVAERAAAHLDVVPRRRSDQVQREIRRDEVGEVELPGPGVGGARRAADQVHRAAFHRQHADHRGADHDLAGLLAAPPG